MEKVNNDDKLYECVTIGLFKRAIAKIIVLEESYFCEEKALGKNFSWIAR